MNFCAHILGKICHILVIMSYNATVLRVTLEKMPSEYLQNCPRTEDCAAVEVRGQLCRPEDCIFPRDPEEKGEIFTLYPGFDCFPSSILFTNCGILGVLFPNIPHFLNRGDIGKQYSQYPTFFANRGDIEKQYSQYPTFSE